MITKYEVAKILSCVMPRLHTFFSFCLLSFGQHTQQIGTAIRCLTSMCAGHGSNSRRYTVILIKDFRGFLLAVLSCESLPLPFSPFHYPDISFSKTVLNLRFPNNIVELLGSAVTGVFSRRTQYYGVT